MYPWTIFLLLIIMLAMAIEIIGGKGRKLRKRDKEEKGHAQFSVGHSSKEGFEEKLDEMVESTSNMLINLGKKVKKGGKKVVKGVVETSK